MMPVDPKLQYKVLYDNGKILCFIGASFVNKTLFNFFQLSRACEIYRLEEIENNTQQWFDKRQFITCSADIKLKLTIVDTIKKYNPHYFSIIAENNSIGNNVKIGKGTHIGDFNVILDDTVIGNHVLLTHYAVVSHNVKIQDFCHIGPGMYILFCTLGVGSYVAAKSNFLGKTNCPIETADYCNYLIGSTVTKNIELQGTYYSNRRLNDKTSLHKKID
jgi:acetyltransferase-like isoleucine patch superfamily enzyme